MRWSDWQSKSMEQRLNQWFQFKSLISNEKWEHFLLPTFIEDVTKHWAFSLIVYSFFESSAFFKNNFLTTATYTKFYGESKRLMGFLQLATVPLQRIYISYTTIWAKIVCVFFKIMIQRIWWVYLTIYLKSLKNLKNFILFISESFLYIPSSKCIIYFTWIKLFLSENLNKS